MPDNDNTYGFDIGNEDVGVATVITVAGDIDISTAPRLSAEVDAVLSAAPAALIVDLTGVGFLGSSAITALAAAHDRSGEQTKIVVVADGPATRRPFEMLGLNTVIDIYSTRAAALAALTAPRS